MKRALSIDAGERARLHASAEKTRDRVAAAMTLFDSAHVASALRLANEALNLHADRRPIALAADFTDDDVTPRHVRDFRAAIASARASADRHADLARAPDAILWCRIRRIVTTILVVAGIVSTLVYRARRPRLIATASASWDRVHGPHRAIDGDADTEWLLPDNTLGDLAIKLVPPRIVHRVRLINAHAPWIYDRSTRDYTLEIYDGTKLVKSIDASFGTGVPFPDWTYHDIGGVHADGVRFVVKTINAKGGGLAEIIVD